MTLYPHLPATPRTILRAIIAVVRRYRHLNLALADQSMVSGCNFLTMIVLARYLGLADFGRYTLAWTVILISSSLHSTVLVSPMTSIAPKQRAEDLPAYFGAIVAQHAVVVAFGFTLIAVGALIFDAIFLTWQSGALALPLACTFAAESTHALLRRYFFTTDNIKRAFASDAIRYVGQLLALIVFVQFAELDVHVALWFMFAGAGLAVVLCVWQIERLRWDRAILRATSVRHWHFSKWLTLGAVMSWASSNVFIVAAGALLGTSAVGAVRAAQALLGPTHIVLKALENIAPVKAARAYHEGGIAALTQYLGRVRIFLCTATAGIGIAAAVAPEFWLNLAFGLEYVGYGYLVQWWAVIYLLTALALPAQVGLTAIERTRGIFISSMIVSVFGFLFAYGLVARFEILGVVGGSVIAGLLRNGMLSFSLLRWLRLLRKGETNVSKAT